jgi:hypothetical protein
LSKALSILFAVPLLAPSACTAAGNLVDSRAAAQSQDLSSYSVIMTGGYYEAGDGGGATFKNVGQAPLHGEDASFVDARGTHWQLVADPAGVNILQFGARCDWNLAQNSSRDYARYDASASDDASALQHAIDFQSLQFANGDDIGGGNGGRVLVPKGACKIATPVRVADQVVVSGAGPLSSVLVMPLTFNPGANFITLGNGDDRASFGSRLEDLQLWSMNRNAAPGTAMVYSNNTQHTGGLFRVKIFAGNRSAIFLTGGAGGASMYYMEHVEVFNTGAEHGGANNPGIVLHYVGSIVQNLRNIVVVGPGDGGPDHIGLRIDGGQVKVDGFHAEGVAVGVDINVIGGPNVGFTRLYNITGGPNCAVLARIESGVAPGTTIMGMAAQNGCSRATVEDLVPGHAPLTGFIVDDRKF